MKRALWLATMCFLLLAKVRDPSGANISLFHAHFDFTRTHFHAII